MRWFVVGVVALVLAGPAQAGTAEVLSVAAGVEVRCVSVIPGVAAVGQQPSGMYDTVNRVVFVRADKCARIRADLAGRLVRRQQVAALRGLAWLTVAHEVAHHHGFDHGETTLPAECAGFRYYLRPLMVKAGLPRWYADRLVKAVKSTGPCIPWTPVG